jgi:hypothetical protein
VRPAVRTHPPATATCSSTTSRGWLGSTSSTVVWALWASSALPIAIRLVLGHQSVSTRAAARSGSPTGSSIAVAPGALPAAGRVDIASAVEGTLCSPPAARSRSRTLEGRSHVGACIGHQITGTPRPGPQPAGQTSAHPSSTTLCNLPPRGPRPSRPSCPASRSLRGRHRQSVRPRPPALASSLAVLQEQQLPARLADR